MWQDSPMLKIGESWCSLNQPCNFCNYEVISKLKINIKTNKQKNELHFNILAHGLAVHSKLPIDGS